MGDVSDIEDGGDDDGLDFAALVPVHEREIGGRKVLAANARTLWALLGAGRNFSHWFADQVESCKLVQGVDYAGWVLAESGQNLHGGRPRRDYVLALDAAKEVGMVDKGPRGKLMRLYFLDVERRLHAGEAAVPLTSIPAVLRGAPAAGAPDPSRVLDRDFICEETYPLSMREFLRLKRVAPDLAAELRVEFERLLIVRVASLLIQGGVFCHPVTKGWVFRREALEAWWRFQGREMANARNFA